MDNGFMRICAAGIILIALVALVICGFQPTQKELVIALVGVVGTVVGALAGVLAAPALKQAAPKADPPSSEAGFARLPALLGIVALMAFLTGCAATDTPQIVAGKSLLAMQQTIVEVRQDIGVPCQKGVIPPGDCQQMDSLYWESKPIYDAAADAAILAQTDPASVPVATARKAALQSLLDELTALAAKYIKVGGAK